jgi:hypothetical protein
MVDQKLNVTTNKLVYYEEKTIKNYLIARYYLIIDYDVSVDCVQYVKRFATG